jgi:hypothetical protein
MLLSRPSRQLCAHPICALKTATKLRNLSKSNKRSKSQNDQAAADAVASALQVQYLASTAAASVIGAAFTIAPHEIMQLLGSHDIVDVTETSAQVYGSECMGSR